MTRYVQHKSGIGEKWEVRNECAITWDCTGADTYALYLPKSEYVEVPAPDRWVDVTAECEVQANGVFTDGLYHRGQSLTYRDYRLRKVQHGQFGWAFIVERKEPS